MDGQTGRGLGDSSLSLADELLSAWLCRLSVPELLHARELLREIKARRVLGCSPDVALVPQLFPRMKTKTGPLPPLA